MSRLYRLMVTDQLEPRLTGRAGCSYTSPPQPLHELHALAVVLLHGAPAPPIDVPITHAVAGGRRTVQITSTPRPRP
jgi:hypothetical protein